MYQTTVFIISKRKELSYKYKKLLEALNQKVYVISSLSEAFREIPAKEPEIIMVSDTIDEKLEDFCEKLRIMTFNFRPIIIAISKSSETSDRLNALEKGADDFLSESIPSQEFQARIKAHLRRYMENSMNRITYFPQKNFTLKYLKRAVESKEDFAFIMVDVFGLNMYREIYSEFAYEKVLQTLTSIINSTLNSVDFAGHHLDSEFLIVTSVEKAEKIAQFLIFAFDNVIERFYSKEDFTNKFIVYSADEKIENKIPLMKLGVGIVENVNERYKNYKDVMQALYNTIKMCKRNENSSCYIDRLKLQGEKQEKEKIKILITEKDEALSCLLKTTCEIKGYETHILDDNEDINELYKNFRPHLAIIDYGEEGTKEGIEICKKIKYMEKNTKVIFSSSLYAKKEILSAGADLYLPKPYDIKTLTEWVERLLEDN